LLLVTEGTKLEVEEQYRLLLLDVKKVQ